MPAQSEGVGVEGWWIEGPVYRATMLVCSIVGAASSLVAVAATVYGATSVD
jgi:hypothetical protein